MTIKHDKVAPAFGRIDVDLMVQTDRLSGDFLGNRKMNGKRLNLQTSMGIVI